MIRKLLQKIIPSRKPRAQAFDGATLGIHPSAIDSAAMSVVKTLQGAGFQAQIVGGAVRDVLMGIAPKDFDVATDAKPEQVKALFRRAFIIGRRFRIVHVIIGREPIEVTTYRGSQDVPDSARDEHGRILSDNVYGTQAEDAARRDFTVNALYYDPISNQVQDFVGAMKDVKARQFRLIGDPEARYREDPVRMLRAIRLSVKLKAKIAKATAAPIKTLAPLLHNVPPARLFDEMQKLLLSGHARATLQALRQYGLQRGLMPLLDVILEQPRGQRFIDCALANTDDRVSQGKGVSPAFLYATLFWHEVEKGWKARTDQGDHSIPALHEAIDEVLDVQAEQVAIPRKLSATMREIWVMQPRFEQRTNNSAARFAEHERFRAAYDFMLLRAQAGECDNELGDWWTRFYDADNSERDAMITDQREAARGAGVKTSSRKRRTRKPKSAAGEPNA